MKKIISAALAATIAVASLGAATLPAAAQGIQFNGGIQFGNTVSNYDNDRRDRRDGRFERRGNYAYYNGQRGQRERRSGWRQYNGFYFPQSAFSLRFTFGNSQGDTRISQRHYAYCDDRYISYRASDNTFQPYNGGRQQCVSPYSN